MEEKVGRKSMKIKRILSIIFIGLISTILLPFNVSAKSISTLDVTDSSNKLTVSGTTENGVLAVAVLVYSNNNLSHMETCSVNNNAYSCQLNKTFEFGTYTVKVADYDGGNYITKDITISEPQPEPEQTVTEENPKTFDGIILHVGLGLISLVGLSGTVLYIKKKGLN